MTERSLFDDRTYAAPDPPAVDSSNTSLAAADAIKPHAAKQRAAVLAFVRSCGWAGATRPEIEAALGMGGDSVRPRVWELIKMNLMTETTRTRPTKSGRPAFVLVATEG